jgi:hypothetical protein
VFASSAYDKSPPVIARSSRDEAIQTVSTEKFLDCFASLAMTESVAGSDASHVDCARSKCRERAAAYSSLPRVIAIDASVLVRMHSMLSRR